MGLTLNKLHATCWITMGLKEREKKKVLVLIQCKTIFHKLHPEGCSGEKYIWTKTF